MAKKKKVKILWHRVFLALFILVVAIWLLVTVISASFHKDSGYNQTPDESSSQAENTINANYDYHIIESSEIHEGELILVNNEIAFQGNEPENLTNALSFYQQLSDKNFYIKDNTVNVQPEVMEAFVNMGNDFFTATGEKNLMLTSGYRSKQRQQELYNEDLERTNSTVSTSVSLPGYSEHNTGYAVDFGIKPENNVYKPYDGTGNFEWIAENAFKYGFILRYTTEKQSITGIESEPWHFRYVGQPHAFIINKNNYCLEEYVDYLKQFDFNKEHLFITSFDNTEYEIYYVPVTDGTTKVPLPKIASYSISGNNIDGFIITVKL